MLRVAVASPLRSYTNGRHEVSAEGATLADVLDDLNRQFPGMRFRMVDEQDRLREHIRIFLDGARCHTLADAVGGGTELQIICAISGG